MTERVVKLAPPPSLDEAVRSAIEEGLREVLAMTIAGEIVNCVIIYERHDNSWNDKTFGSVDFSKSIGRLEILKQNWISTFIAHSGRTSDEQ